MSEASFLKRQLAAGQISRRAFIGRMAALGATGLVATRMADRALAATPVRGGHMRFAMGHGGTSDVLDPGKVLNGFCRASTTPSPIP